MVPLLMDVYEEHLEEAGFLWVQWERSLVAPDSSLEDVARLEERLLAHLDALVVGGEPVARELLLPALDSEDAPRISAALWALLAEPGCLKWTDLLARVGSASSDILAALGRALELTERPEVDEVLLPLVKSSDKASRVWAIDVLAARGALPSEVERVLSERTEASVVTAVLRGLPFLSRDAVSRELPRLLEDAHSEVRNAALLLGMRSGARTAWAACREAVEARRPMDRTALVLLALSGDARDWQRLMAWTETEALRADALWALGFSGRRESADACLEFMASRPVAALAGESFSAITGLTLEGAYAEAPREEDPLPPLEEDLVRSLEPRPEDALPVPAHAAVAAWWKDARKDFAPGVRYLRGRVFDLDVLGEELERGPMRRRHVLALEWVLRSQGVCRLPTRVFTQGQRAGLARARELLGRLSASAFPRLEGGR